jgi:hypothetical protein
MKAEMEASGLTYKDNMGKSG